MTDVLRPVERRILAMRDEGIDTAEIARRFKRSEDFIERVIAWTQIPRRKVARHQGLSPIERRVVDLRTDGLSYEEIGQRFRRSPDHIRRVEGYAHLRSNLGLD
jgi:DNA-binding CsgD family transcriptional regulator